MPPKHSFVLTCMPMAAIALPACKEQPRPRAGGTVQGSEGAVKGDERTLMNQKVEQGKG